jgi:hypothetical protein
MNALECAITAYDLNRYICINEFDPSPDEFFRRMESELTELENPESILLAKEFDCLEAVWFNALSEEAKQVIQLIIDPPDEMRVIIGSGKKNISLKKLAEYLRRQWDERRIVRKVLQEIAQYVARLEAYHING